MRKSWKHFTKEEIASWPDEHKACRMCQEVLPFLEFSKNERTLFGLDTNCKQCRKPKSRADAASRTFEQTMLSSSKHRAKKRGLEHTITLQDIVIPEHCPVLHAPIILERGHMYRPSLDRINPNRGYTPDNICVMSWRANTLKNNMTYFEAEDLAGWMRDNGVAGKKWYVPSPPE